jgi:tRNA pseudouridine38-40 synthase
LSALRAALWLWYRGARFRGWQRQVLGPTVQQVVEEGLQARGVASGLAAAGRTDRGVHARQQIVSLRVPPGTDFDALSRGLHGEDWGCAAAAAAPEGFHAQWSPSSKEYRYRLSVGIPPQRWAAYVWRLQTEARVRGPVTAQALGRALAVAQGTRDFSAFHANSSVRRPRTLGLVECREGQDGLLEVRLVGSGFGRYQVRALVGGAVLLASGQLTEAAWRAALEDAVPFEGLLAPPQGLVLWALDYGGRSPFDARLGELPHGPPFEGVT